MTEEERNLARKFLQEMDLEGYRWTANGREKYIVDNVFHKMLDLEQKINKLNNVIDKMAERLINYDIDEDICSKIKKPESEEDDCYLDVYFGSEVCKNCVKEYFMKE